MPELFESAENGKGRIIEIKEQNIMLKLADLLLKEQLIRLDEKWKLNKLIQNKLIQNKRDA